MQLQQMRNAASKQDAEASKSKEDCNALRTTITDIRDKINDLETKVGRIWLSPIYISHAIHWLCYSNTTVYYGTHERSECIPVDSGVTNLIHDCCSCVDFTLEVEANVARCVHSSVNKPGVKRNSGL